MKNLKIIYTLLFSLMFVLSCEQERLIPTAPELVIPTDPCGENPTAGSADFTKFVAIGNSFVAGVQGAALFTGGQDNSLPAIMNKQFECVGAPADFKQPTIGASLGWNLFATQEILTDPTQPVLGRLLLQYGTNIDCETGEPSPLPTAQAYGAGQLEALPDPTLNQGFIYTESKTELNNFGVPAITVLQTLIPNTGNWAVPDPAQGFSPFYARFASNPGTSSIISDAIAAQGTFFLFWAGLDDFFLHAAFGADPTKAPLTPASGGFPTGFEGNYSTAVGSILMSNPNLKGVVGNFPNIFVMPHFTAVSYNPIPLDAASATAINAGFAGYNAALDGLIANAAGFGISETLKAEIATRKVFYEASCSNKILLIDETLTDLGPYFDGLLGADAITAEQRAALVPYEQVRQTKNTDIIPLSTGSVLGTLVNDDPTLVNGVTVPVADQYVLIPSEIQAIEAARTSYNQTVAALVAANSTRLALADVDAGYTGLVTGQAAVENGVTITPNIDPPTGIYSEDGVHPNSRGYAFTANIFIDAINAKFGSTVPKVNIGNYSATGLPIP